MPPAKTRPAHDDTRSEASTARERQVAAAAHARSKKHTAASTQQNGSSLKELALVSAESGNVVTPGQSAGLNWSKEDPKLLDQYRIAHNLNQPAAFTSPRNQALLSHGLGLQSPTMVRRREKRRISKEQLASAVRKNFNSAAASETDVVVGLLYKVRHQAETFGYESDTRDNEQDAESNEKSAPDKEADVTSKESNVLGKDTDAPRKKRKYTRRKKPDARPREANAPSPETDALREETNAPSLEIDSTRMEVNASSPEAGALRKKLNAPDKNTDVPGKGTDISSNVTNADGVSKLFGGSRTLAEMVFAGARDHDQRQRDRAIWRSDE